MCYWVPSLEFVIALIIQHIPAAEYGGRQIYGDGSGRRKSMDWKQSQRYFYTKIISNWRVARLLVFCPSSPGINPRHRPSMEIQFGLVIIKIKFPLRLKL